jgi:hypothetical protein
LIVSNSFERHRVVLEMKLVDRQMGRISAVCTHFIFFLPKCTKTTVLHPKHAHSIDSNCSVVLAGLTKGEKIVASDPLPQTIEKFEVHNAIRRSQMKRWYHKGHYLLKS